MAVKAKELQEFRPVIRYPSGTDVTLSRLEDEIRKQAAEYSLPIWIEEDEVKYGLFDDRVPCLLLMHPDHQLDYMKFCAQIRYQGDNPLVSVHLYGTSRQLKKEAVAGQSTGAVGALLFGGAAGVGYAICAGLRKAVNAIGKNRSKLEEEKIWYSQVSEIFDQIVY